jgi:glycerol kinase
MPELILALDVGTSALGAGLFRPDGTAAGFATQRLVSTSPGPGMLEQDADKVWRAARKTIAAVLAAAGRAPADLAAIGVTSQRTSAVVWDRRNGKPLSPMVIWSDLRGVGRSAQLRAEGFTVYPQQAAAKLEGIVAAVPPDARAGMLWGNIDSYLIWKLTGGAVHATDRSQAFPTAYLDLSTLNWNQGLIDHQGLDPSTFPTLVDTWGPIGVTARSVLGAEVPITADVADQQAALIAHGGGAGSAKVTYGTSATMNLGTGSALVARSATAPPFVLSSVGGDTRFCLEGMVYSAASALDWLRATFRMGGHAAFDALAAQTSDPGGVAFLPALQGLGAPHGDAARRGLFTGLASETTRAQIARAGFEGVAFRVREVFEHLYEISGMTPPKALGVDGGLSASDQFLQIQADLLGRPIRRHAIGEATACGAAICAGLGAGVLTEADAQAFVRYERTFAPSLAENEGLERFEAWKTAVYR